MINELAFLLELLIINLKKICKNYYLHIFYLQGVPSNSKIISFSNSKISLSLENPAASLCHHHQNFWHSTETSISLLLKLALFFQFLIGYNKNHTSLPEILARNSLVNPAISLSFVQVFSKTDLSTTQ